VVFSISSVFHAIGLPLESVSEGIMFWGCSSARSFCCPDRYWYHYILWTAWTIWMKCTGNIS